MSKNLIKNLIDKFSSDLYSIEEEVFLHIEGLEEQLDQKDKESRRHIDEYGRLYRELKELKARNEKLERVVEVHKKWFASIKTVNYLNQDDSLFDDLEEAINQLNEVEHDI